MITNTATISGSIWFLFALDVFIILLVIRLEKYTHSCTNIDATAERSDILERERLDILERRLKHDDEVTKEMIDAALNEWVTVKKASFTDAWEVEAMLKAALKAKR